MNIKEFYQKINANYDDMFSRLNNEDLMNKIVKMFLNDTAYNDLKKGLEDKDAELAFRGAHTLKGVCLNLGFSNLSDMIIELTENLRPRVINDESYALFNKVTDEYNKTIEALKELD